MFKLECRKTKIINASNNVFTLMAWAIICMTFIGTIALPVEALPKKVPRKNKIPPSSEASQQSDESAGKKSEGEKSPYFRISLSGTFGRYRYKEDWGLNKSRNEIGRYQGPGIGAALDMGRQRKSGFAFGAAFQLGFFPALNRFSLDSDSGGVESETEKIMFFMAGFVFRHHPFGLQNGSYFAIRPGISLMHGVPNYLPVPLPGFSVAIGYDFFNRKAAHLGVEAKLTSVFGIGGLDTDFNSSDIRARIISFGVAFTVAYY